MTNQELDLDAKLIKKWENLLGSEIKGFEPQGGGFIAKAYVGELTNGEHFFVKTGQPSEVFRREAYSLDLLRSHFLTPEVIGIVEDSLLLEYMKRGKGDSSRYFSFGVKLAELHRDTLADNERPGFPFNNTIGATLQLNENDNLDWASFFWELRLRPQLEWCEQKGFHFSEMEKELVQDKTLSLLNEVKEKCTSLLHGDLWGGNHAFTAEGEPWIYDPASYYGHREADLAMMRLFQGYPEEAFRGYETNFPLEKGSEKRLPLYELYHVLNHINLFGGSYVGQAKAIINRLTNL